MINPILDGARQRYRVATAEVDHQDKWQRAALGVSVVGASARHVESVAEAVERFVWSFPEIEVLDATWSWLES